MNRGLLRVRLLAWAGIGLSLMAARALVAQGQPQPAPPLPTINQSDDPILKPFVWRSIGPANMGGRIDDIAVVEGNPSIIYMGFATGGLWKSTNNGTTWTSLFDSYPVSSIGDIAIAPSNPDIIYVGTGEPNNRQSSSFGAGVYKSTDAGKRFEYIGLKETQTIARVVVDPKNADIVYVAAVGHLFGPNPERGLYKTTDGGKTWTNTKFIDENTGFTDVAIDPSNPKVLVAASYQRRRVPWGFNGGGPGSGLWKTTDAAKTWTKLTGNGLPANPIIGRIGLDIARSKPSTIYATIEVGASGGTGAGVNDDGTLAAPGQRGGGGGGGRGQALPPPDPNKSGVWRSDDSGRTWKFLSNRGDRWMYYSKIRIDPTNPEIAYQGGAPFFKTVDGGKTWRTVDGLAHSDHHAIWINPANNNHLLVGNDGGLNVTYDQGESWEFINTMAVGQFYAISADMRKPYVVCGGLQDNGSWCGPSATRSANGILNSDWYRIGGGDGFYTQNDPTDWTTVYSESQDGNTNRLNLRTGSSTSIRPRGPGGRGGGGAPAANPGDAGPGAASRCRRQPGGQRRARAAAGHELSLLLEHAVHPVAAQPAHRVPRRRSAVPIVRPRRHLDGVAGSDEQHRPQRSADHGRHGHRPDGLQARRRRVVQQHRHRRRIAARAGPPLGRHQRRQRAGEPRQRQHLEERRRQRARCAEGNARLTRRAVAVRRRHLLRHLRRTPHQRPQAVRLQDDGLRRDVDVDLGEPARGERQRDP